MATAHQLKVCYVNPTLLLRRPISEMLSLQPNAEVALLTPRRKGAKRDTSLHHSDSFKHAKIYTYETLQFPFSESEWPLPGIGFFKQARKVLKTYDVVHVWGHFYLSTFLLLLMSLFIRRAKVVLSIDTFPGYSFSVGSLMDILFRIYTWTFGRVVYGAADAITLYGNALRVHAKRSGIAMSKVHVIPTGIKQKEPVSLLTQRNLRRSLRLPPGYKIVFYSGLINWRKGVDVILEVADAMKEEKVIFLLAGDGPDKRHYEATCHKRGLTNVRFLGWRQDITELLSISDVFLFPSTAEGLAGSVMEAMQAGVPVLTTAIPCTTDLITDGKEGLLCPVGATGCFVRKLKTVLTNKTLATSLSSAAQKKIQMDFSWSTIMPQYKTLYETALSPRH